MPRLSTDGRFVTFESGAANLADNDGDQTLDIFVRDRELETTELVSVGSTGELGRLGGVDPEFTKDGRLVLFFSSAPNLVKNDTNNAYDIFVRGPYVVPSGS